MTLGAGDVADHLTGRLTDRLAGGFGRTRSLLRAQNDFDVRDALTWVSVDLFATQAECIGWKGKCLVCGGRMRFNDIHFECY